MDWRNIPSLAALRAFEASARNCSFSAAARELNVTQAAIAQHVRGLETRLGLVLIRRQGHNMVTTDAGARLAAALSEGFSTIAEGIQQLSTDQENRPLVLSLTPSFAESWLMPRLGGFWASHPDIGLSLQPSTDLVDMRRDGIDLAIRFGNGTWPGLQIEPLLMSPFVVVASKAYAKGAKTLTDMGDAKKLRWFFAFAAMEQQVWGRTIGLDFEDIPFEDMATLGMAHAAVRAGHGLSIQARSLVETDLSEGRMIALQQGESGGLGYHLVTRDNVPSAKLKRLVRWLRHQAADPAQDQATKPGASATTPPFAGPA
jgi:LysR family transcriptional regulator, glycine cleavage system transcriptional activator